MAKLRLTFKREKRVTGLACSAYNDELRLCRIRLDGGDVGHIYNRAHSHVVRGENVWRVCMYARDTGERRNVVLRARFVMLDEAKAFVKRNWKAISDRYQIEEWHLQ